MTDDVQGSYNAENRYNGWKNYPTWCVNLWLSNDRQLYETTRETARDYIGDAGQLSRVLKDWVTDELTPDLGATFAADLLGYALDEVDWYEIAEAWLSEDFAYDKAPTT